MSGTDSIPVIDISALVRAETAANSPADNDISQTSVDEDVRSAADAIGAALQSSGFFYVRNHGVPQSLIDSLWRVSKQFFALPLEEKMKIDMKLGGRAWRGFFPCGGELTSGKPDHKEGLYLGSDLGPDHPSVKRGLPFHGANQYPEAVPEMKTVIRTYLKHMTTLGHAVMRGLAVSVGLDPAFFKTAMTADPFTPFRIFNYPAPVRKCSTNSCRLSARANQTGWGLSLLRCCLTT